MAVNLVAQFGRERARELLETSFAQFQADRAVVGFVRTIRRNQEALAGYAEAMQCDRGDFAAYAAHPRRDRASSRRTPSKAPGRERPRGGGGEPGEAAGRRRHPDPGRPARGLRGRGAGQPGRPRRDAVAGGRHRGPAAAPAHRSSTSRRPSSRSPRSRCRQALQRQEPQVPARPRHVAAHRGAPRPAAGRAAAATRIPTSPSRIEELRRQMRAHPCHACPDREQHARWAERWWRLTRETEGLQRKVDGRTNSVARTFDRICDLLEEMDYLGPGGDHGDAARGAAAAALHREGPARRRVPAPRGLGPARRPGPRRRHLGPRPRAAPRGDRDQPADAEPSTSREAWSEMVRLWSALEDREREQRPAARRVTRTAASRGWSTGGPAADQLEAVLRGSDIAAGDFVRRCKQIIDLLDQVADAAANSGSPRLVGHRPLGGGRGAARCRRRRPDRLTVASPDVGQRWYAALEAPQVRLCCAW